MNEAGTVPLVSVVTATYNRKETLAVTLQRLAEQTFSPDLYEVIVVDDGSTDGTEESIAQLRPELPCAFRYLRQSPNQGPGAANNRGAREARADIILFLADDMHATPPVVASHY